MKKAKLTLVFILAVLISLNGNGQINKTEEGGAAGAGGGGIIGGIIGHEAGNTVIGAIIGAAVGGAAGAAIGHYMDKQAKEIKQDLKGAKVERVGEGIKITFDSGILFNIDSDALKPIAEQHIRDLAKTLNKYKDTHVLIEGHTDNTGSDDHNQVLSEKRAAAVGDYAEAQGVAADRITEKGYGKTQPAADNNTEAGRSQNRRVEIAIMANDKLKHAAKKGKLNSD
jgi:outer membrane protein OmpA-like peptidoglycan-associated protein